MAASEVDTETQLITYVKNILKYQIIPMDCMNLRNLVKEAPKNMNLYEYIEQNYPDAQFLEFLGKYPHIFKLNSDSTVVLSEENSFTLPYVTPYPAEYSDEVDGPNKVDVRDRAEYVSDSDSESSGAEDDRLLKKERPKRAADRLDSTSSESSIDLFSSEMVHTSDSDHSSLTSSSSSED